MAKHVIAQVNPAMPSTHGDGFIHISNLHTMVWDKSPLPEVDYSAKVNAAMVTIGQHIASLIDDGDHWENLERACFERFKI